MKSCRSLVALLFPLLLPAVAVAAVPSTPADAAPAPPGPSVADIAYRFALAKSLAADGSIPQAARELAEVVRLVPDDPYVRLEYAAVLSDLATAAPSSRMAQEHLAEAHRQAEAALALDPENLEAWRAVAEARLSLADGDREALDGAIEALEKVHQGDPADYRTALILGQIHLEAGELQRAVEVLERLAAEVPSHPQIDGPLVQAYLAAGRKPEAEAVLGRLLAADPSRVDVRLELAGLASERGDHEKALEVLQLAPPAVAGEATVERRVVLELYHLGRFDQALERLAAMGGDDPTSGALRALVLAAQGRHVDFAATLAAIDLDLGVHGQLSRMLEQRGADAQAVEVLSTALARLEAGEQAVGPAVEQSTLPAAVLVRDDLASLEARLGRPADAVALLEPLLAHPEPAVRSGARLRSAALLVEAGETERALALLAAGEGGPEADLIRLDAYFGEGEERQATRLFRRLAASGDARTVRLAAGIAQDHQRLDLSIPVLEALVERDPSPEALFQLGAVYERSGRIEQAVGTFRRLLAAHPQFDEALNYLGYLWADRGENLSEALDMIRRAVAAEPDNAAYLDSLGWVHHRLGENELALRYLERAASLLPGDPEVLEHLGDVHRRLGDRERARELYRSALAAGESEDPDLRRKIEELTAVD